MIQIRVPEPPVDDKEIGVPYVPLDELRLSGAWAASANVIVTGAEIANT